MNGGLKGLSVVVPCNSSRVDGLADLVDVTFGGDADSETAVGGDNGIVAGDFAIAGVGDARFDAVANVVVMLIDARGNLDFQLSIGVELAGLFGDLSAAVISVFLPIA